MYKFRLRLIRQISMNVFAESAEDVLAMARGLIKSGDVYEYDEGVWEINFVGQAILPPEEMQYAIVDGELQKL